MENSPYQRLELFWKAKGLKNAAAFAESVNGLTPAALSAMKKRSSLPSAPSMRYIQIAYPDINPDYVLFGEGEMLKDGHTLTPVQPEPTVETGPDTTPASTVPSPSTVERRHTAPMAILPDMAGMTPEQQIECLMVRLTLAEDELATMKNAERHKEAVQLIRSAGGRPFSSASPYAADTTDTPPVMVAETNHEYVERAAEAERNQIGFVYGQGR